MVGNDAQAGCAFSWRDVGLVNKLESVVPFGDFGVEAVGRTADFFRAGLFPNGTLGASAELLMLAKLSCVRMHGFEAGVQDCVAIVTEFE